MTKHVHDPLSAAVEDLKIEVTPKLIDNTTIITAPHVLPKSKKVKARMVKTKVTAKKSRLEKATSQLYDLEDHCSPERALNIDLGLYQMEDY